MFKTDIDILIENSIYEIAVNMQILIIPMY